MHAVENELDRLSNITFQTPKTSLDRLPPIPLSELLFHVSFHLQPITCSSYVALGRICRLWRDTTWPTPSSATLKFSSPLHNLRCDILIWQGGYPPVTRIATPRDLDPTSVLRDLPRVRFLWACCGCVWRVPGNARHWTPVWAFRPTCPRGGGHRLSVSGRSLGLCGILPLCRQLGSFT